ncbi:putative oxidoreductase [Labilithrix luteola]|uniref:Putative oxidoreductase n=1 Tax=Labilithrix luteola TaxID=1391654 RepID=A0A0K1PVT3_9BACT|nr:Gfo/Idh/MocA family oxidoreductase [Labilithrix luteola]AKU97496.1 putative oxidoreductase [Labilithrix luteola]
MTNSNRIRVGVIGASPNWGWASYVHLPALAALPAYEMTAVSTTKQASAEETARKFGIRHAFDDGVRLIEHPEVDLVVVSVRAPEHARLVRAACAAKKDVLCEWPLGVSLEETRELAKLADEAGIRTLIGLQRRLAPGVLYLRDLVHDGYVGRIRSVTLEISTPLLGHRRPRAYAYTADERNGVNVLYTVLAHFLDTVLHATSPIESLSAVVARTFDTTTIEETNEVIAVTAPDEVSLVGRLTSGAVLTARAESGKRNGSTIACTITGTDGDLVLGADFGVSGTKGDGQPLAPMPTPERYFMVPKGNLSDDVLPMAQLYAAYAKDRAEDTHRAPSFRDALAFHELLGRIDEAGTTRQRITLR